MHEINIYLLVTDFFAQRIHLIVEFYGNWRFSSLLARWSHVN